MPHSAWPPQGLLNLLEVVWNLTLLLQLPESKWEGRVAVYMNILHISLRVCVCAHFFFNIHTITYTCMIMYVYVCVCSIYYLPPKKKVKGQLRNTSTKFLAGLGPEPLSNHFHWETMTHKTCELPRLHKGVPEKPALLEQKFWPEEPLAGCRFPCDIIFHHPTSSGRLTK